MEDVKELMTQEGWNVDLLNELLSEDTSNYVIYKIGIVKGSEEWDKPWWMLQSSKKFSS